MLDGMKYRTLTLPLLGIVLFFAAFIAWPKATDNSKPVKQFVPMSVATQHHEQTEFKQKEKKNQKPIPVKFGLKASFVKLEGK